MNGSELKHKLDALKGHVADLQARTREDDTLAKRDISTTFKEIQVLLEDLGQAQRETDSRRKAVDADYGRHQALQQSHDALKSRVHKGDAQLARAGEALQAEIDNHARTEVNLAKHQAALEVVYQLAITRPGSMEALGDQVVLNLSNLMNVPQTILYRMEKNNLKIMSSLMEEAFTHHGDARLPCGPCATACRDKRPHQCTGILKDRFADSPCLKGKDFRSYIGVPVMDNAGKLAGILCAMDFDDRVFSEEEVHLMEILARYVANEFVREEMERQRMESKRFQTLGQLTSGVAHEVRNPINAILILSEALEARLGESSEYSHYLERIRTQVNRLSNLMQDLLDLGKPLRLSRLERVPLATLCSEAMDLWKQSAAESGPSVRLDQPGDDPEISVLGEKDKLKQVFINFLENAAQHSPEDSEIVVSILPPEEDVVRVRVIDRGCGIPPENLSRVFEPFFTAHKKGTGLGLSLVKQIVEAHKGEVAIRNNDPFPGCTVEVCLPPSLGEEA